MLFDSQLLIVTINQTCTVDVWVWLLLAPNCGLRNLFLSYKLWFLMTFGLQVLLVTLKLVWFILELAPEFWVKIVVSNAF